MLMLMLYIRCCNTCEDLKAAYLRKGWTLTNILKDSVQCLRDKSNPFSSVRPGEGCRVTGTMLVNKVAGNFHIAHGESIIKDGHHIHQFNPAEAPKFNVSHTIHSISFGEPYPSMPPNPLDSGTDMMTMMMMMLLIHNNADDLDDVDDELDDDDDDDANDVLHDDDDNERDDDEHDDVLFAHSASYRGLPDWHRSLPVLHQGDPHCVHE